MALSSIAAAILPNLTSLEVSTGAVGEAGVAALCFRSSSGSSSSSSSLFFFFFFCCCCYCCCCFTLLSFCFDTAVATAAPGCLETAPPRLPGEREARRRRHPQAGGRRDSADEPGPVEDRRHRLGPRGARGAVFARAFGPDEDPAAAGAGAGAGGVGGLGSAAAAAGGGSGSGRSFNAAFAALEALSASLPRLRRIKTA